MRFKDSMTVRSYWNSLRRGAAMPLKRDFDPFAVTSALPYVFLLERAGSGWKFRLAGTGLRDIYGFEPTGSAFGEIWGGDFAKVRAVMESCAARRMSTIVEWKGGNDGRMVEFETLMLPMSRDADVLDGRVMLGVVGYDRAAAPSWIGSRPLTSAEVSAVGELPHAPSGAGEPAALSKGATPGPKLSVIRGGLA